MIPKFRARFEITGGNIRIYPHDAPPDAEFLFAMSAIADEGTATLKALAAIDIRHAHYDAVRACLRARGFHTAKWTRRDPLTGQRRHILAPTGLALDDPAVNTA